MFTAIGRGLRLSGFTGKLGVCTPNNRSISSRYGLGPGRPHSESKEANNITGRLYILSSQRLRQFTVYSKGRFPI